jgi:hypothetical protein
MGNNQNANELMKEMKEIKLKMAALEVWMPRSNNYLGVEKNSFYSQLGECLQNIEVSLGSLVS